MRSKILLSGLAALLIPLTNDGMALAGQISVIPPPVIVTPVPTPVTPSVPVAPAAPAPTTGGANVNVGVTGGGTAGGGGGAASVSVDTLQSFNVTTLSPGQMQVAAATIRGLLAAPGGMSSAQVATLQSQLAQMNAIMAQ